MMNELAALFTKFDVEWCDNPGAHIQDTEFYQQLMTIFPNLEIIHQKGLRNDPLEFNRTMRHIFRALKIYFLLSNAELEHKSLSSRSLDAIRMKIRTFEQMNPLFLPLILIYHDIGRFIDRKTHTVQSSRLIKTHALLNRFGLSEIDQLLLRKVIEYHLFFATIYTGESTFFGILSLLNDEEFIALISHQNRLYADLFIDLLETFTFLDILGYPYAQIYDHYLKYYDIINLQLKQLLTLWPDPQTISLAKNFSLQWTDWRLAGALRIFQFVGTKPHLTEDFYYNVLRRRLPTVVNQLHHDPFDWDEFKRTKLSHIYKFQMHYALPLLMILAFGEFKRFRLKEDQSISSNLLLFWVHLSQEITNRGLGEKEAVWNIYFDNLPLWSEMTPQLIAKLQMPNLSAIIQQGRIAFDIERKDYNFYLDFSSLVE